MRIVATGHDRKGRRRYYTLGLTRRGEVVFKRVPTRYGQRVDLRTLYAFTPGIDADGWTVFFSPHIDYGFVLKQLGLLTGHPERVQNAIVAAVMLQEGT